MSSHSVTPRRERPRASGGECALPLAEPLHSLRVLNQILLVFAGLYGLLYLLGFLCTPLAYYTKSEQVTFTVAFLFNLLNVAAMVSFLVGTSRRQLSLIRAYLTLNGIALAIEGIGLLFVYLFGGSLTVNEPVNLTQLRLIAPHLPLFPFSDFIWRVRILNLLSTAFVLLFEVVFISGNALVYSLVVIHIPSELPGKSVPARIAIASDIMLARDELEASGE